MADHQAERVPVSVVKVAATTTDEALAFINETYVGARIRLGGGGGNFRYDLAGFATPSLQVGRFRYTRGLTMDLDPFGYLMSLAMSGGNLTVARRGSKRPAAAARSSSCRPLARCG